MANALESLENKPPESDQAPSTTETSAPAREPSSQEQTEPEYFSDNFDPSTLDEALQPAYRQLRGDYTRKTQELAEQRKQAEAATAFFEDLQSEDTREHALQWFAQQVGGPEALAAALGFEVDDDEQSTSEPDEPDPVREMRSEWEQFKAEREAEQARKAEDDYVARVDRGVQEQMQALAKQAGVDELPQRTQELLVSRALVAHTGPDGMPNVRAAFDELEAEWTERQKGWASSKETTHIQPGGQEATEVPDLDNEEARRDFMASKLQPWIDQSST
jgi:HD-GYP domain-containing protein (c-di-GMP phosphodiesterase class II)